jgi:hypothetical protein
MIRLWTAQSIGAGAAASSSAFDIPVDKTVITVYVKPATSTTHTLIVQWNPDPTVLPTQFFNANAVGITAPGNAGQTAWSNYAGNASYVAPTGGRRSARINLTNNDAGTQTFDAWVEFSSHRVKTVG